MNIETIGATGARATADAWIAAHTVPLDDQQGELQAQEHAGNITLDGATPGLFKFHLTVVSGGQHDGRHNGKSGAGNARITVNANAIPIRAYIQSLRISWAEVDGPGNFNQPIIRIAAGSGDNNVTLDHMILHNDGRSSGTDQHGVNCEAAVVLKHHRIITFGVGGAGIWCLSAAAGSAFLYDTFYGCRISVNTDDAGITNVDNDVLVKYNALFDNNGKDLYSLNGTLDYNYTSDVTGDDEGANGRASLSSANQFVNPTTTWADLDLLVKAGADLIGAGVAESGSTYPDIDYAINNRTTPITGSWDIGAAQRFAAAGSSFPPVPQPISPYLTLVTL